MSYPWLPDEIDYNSFGGKFQPFLDEVYRIFKRDFLDSQATIKGRPLSVNRTLDEGREATFWHLVSRDYKVNGGGDRDPDIARARKLPWARAILDAIEKENTHEDIHIWLVPESREEGRRENRIKIALANFSYLIVIGMRANGGIVMVTAFPTEGHYPKTVRKDFERFGGR